MERKETVSTKGTLNFQETLYANISRQISEIREKAVPVPNIYEDCADH
jgi:hypothetical protein